MAHYEQDDLKFLNNCIGKCQKCIDECQNIIDTCTVRAPVECGKEIGQLVVAATECIDACQETEKVIKEHMRKCSDKQCLTLSQDLMDKCHMTVSRCKDVIEVCKDRQMICIETTLQCIKACNACSLACAKVKDYNGQ